MFYTPLKPDRPNPTDRSGAGIRTDETRYGHFANRTKHTGNKVRACPMPRSLWPPLLRLRPAALQSIDPAPSAHPCASPSDHTCKHHRNASPAKTRRSHRLTWLGPLACPAHTGTPHTPPAKPCATSHLRHVTSAVPTLTGQLSKNDEAHYVPQAVSGAAERHIKRHFSS